MKFDGGAAFVLLILGVLVGGILFMLIRFWGQCNADVAYARERVVWPTTTVEATLYDAYVYTRRNHSSVKGKYRYKFGETEHTTELYEGIGGSRTEKDEAAHRLKEEGKTVNLKVQYNPKDASMVSNDIVTSVPNCRPWIAGFLVFFGLIEFFILRGLYKLVRGIFR